MSATARLNTTELNPIDHPAAWSVQSLKAQSDRWVYELTTDDLIELDAALQTVKSAGLVVPHFSCDDFPMPNLAASLDSYMKELDSGLGIVHIKGFPAQSYSKDDASLIFWGIGSYVGKPWQQNARGHVLGDIVDEGRSMDDPTARAYQTTVEMDLHTDLADLLGLLCLKQAPVGGENQIVSAVSALNRLIEDDPKTAEYLLNTEFFIDWRGEEGPGEEPYYRAPLFTRLNEGVACLSLIPYVHSAQRFEEVPRLTERDNLAFEAFGKAKWDDDLVLRLRQQPGDMLFLNNHYLMHARSEYKDSPEPGERRHLRRLWLESDAWSAKRPAAMAAVLKKVRANWETGAGVQMWDKPQETV